MSRPKSFKLLVLVSSVALLLAVSGCIEARDPPPAGDFTIDVESESVFFVPEDGGELEGAHAHVETELHHEHPEYSWDVEGVGEYEGSAVEIPATTVGLRTATYDLLYYEQHQWLPVLVATVPDLTDVYLVVGNGTQLDENLTLDEGLNITMGPDLQDLHTDELGSVMEYSGDLEEGIHFNVSLDAAASNATSYLLGVHVTGGNPPDEETGSVVIHPGETHSLLFAEGELSVTIAPTDDPDNITYEGPLADLPSEYRTDIGLLAWEGHVGETEEAPGMAAWTALLAFVVVVVVAERSRRR